MRAWQWGNGGQLTVLFTQRLDWSEIQRTQWAGFNADRLLPLRNALCLASLR